MNDLPFGMSHYTTWPQTFEQDLELYRSAGIRFIEVCETKLDAANSESQLQLLVNSGLCVASMQPKLYSLFPDFPRPDPKSSGERMAELRKSKT